MRKNLKVYKPQEPPLLPPIMSCLCLKPPGVFYSLHMEGNPSFSPWRKIPCNLIFSSYTSPFVPLCPSHGFSSGCPNTPSMFPWRALAPDFPRLEYFCSKPLHGWSFSSLWWWFKDTFSGRPSLHLVQLRPCLPHPQRLYHCPSSLFFFP